MRKRDNKLNLLTCLENIHPISEPYSRINLTINQIGIVRIFLFKSFILFFIKNNKSYFFVLIWLREVLERKRRDENKFWNAHFHFRKIRVDRIYH